MLDVMPKGATMDVCEVALRVIGRLAIAGTVALALCGTPAASQASTASPRECHVRIAGSYWTFTALDKAVRVAREGDRLAVQGTCRGATRISTDLTIVGVRPEGWSKPTLTAGGDGRVVVVTRNATVLISDLVITQGSSPRGGGGVRNAGTLTLRDVVVRRNESVFAGGVLNTGTLALEGSTTISDNDGAVGAGGGVLNEGTMTMAGSSAIRGNSSGGGGGVCNCGPRSSLTMLDTSSIHGNRARSGYAFFAGGGVSNEGTLTLNDQSDIHGNRAGVGGGVENQGVVVLNDAASIHHNVARNYYDYGSGGGVANDGTLTLNGASSIHDNEAGTEGGGVYNDANEVVRGVVAMNGTASIHGNHAPGGAGVLNLGTFTMTDEAAIHDNVAEDPGGGILDIDGTLAGVVCPPEPGTNVNGNVPDDCYVFGHQARSDIEDDEAFGVGGALAHAERAAREEGEEEALGASVADRQASTQGDSPTAEADDSVSTMPHAPALGHFTGADSLNEARWGHTATLLPDGRVLIVGGFAASDPDADVYEPPPPHASCELWDPVTQAFRPTGSLAEARVGHTATLLPDGRVLVVGGASSTEDGDYFPETAEIWEPEGGTFGPAGSLDGPREAHTATLLSDGRVLVIGGWNNYQGLAEVWDPTMMDFIPAGSVRGGTYFHTATLLPDRRVVVIGGIDEDYEQRNRVEVWNPATSAFARIATMPEPRSQHTAALLPDGRVAVLGGVTEDGLTTEILAWDPASAAFSPVARLTEPRLDHTMTVLPDGRMLVVGGGALTMGTAMAGSSYLLASAEVCDVGTWECSPAGPMAGTRGFHTATLLADGSVLVVGGVGLDAADGGGVLASAEIWKPL